MTHRAARGRHEVLELREDLRAGMIGVGDEERLSLHEALSGAAGGHPLIHGARIRFKEGLWTMKACLHRG